MLIDYELQKNSYERLFTNVTYVPTQAQTCVLQLYFKNYQGKDKKLIYLYDNLLKLNIYFFFFFLLFHRYVGTWKYELHAESTILWARICFPSVAKVTSHIVSLLSREENTAMKFGWWLFHRRQNCWVGVAIAYDIYDLGREKNSIVNIMVLFSVSVLLEMSLHCHLWNGLSAQVNLPRKP